MSRILARPRTIKSARLIGYPAYQDSITDLLPGESVIIWGNSDARPIEGHPMLNSNSRICTNKLRMHQTFQAGEVPSPTLYERDIPDGVEAVIRPLEHQGGSGFMRGRGPLRVPSGHYATEFLESELEYRVFFFNEEKFNVCRTKTSGDSLECRSQWDYYYCRCGPRISEIVDKARRATQLDFGAVDILDLNGRSNYMVLEVNTAPALDDDRVLGWFQMRLDNWVEENETTEVNLYSRSLHSTREMKRGLISAT